MMLDLTTTRSRVVRRRTARAGSVGILGVALVLGGCGTEPSGQPGTAGVEQPSPPGQPSTAPSTSPAPASRDVPVRPATDSATQAGPAPVRIRATELGLDVPVLPTGTEPDGTMELPDSADDAGWYRFGPAPGDDHGAVVVAAHVDDEDSVGPFARLVDVSGGDAVVVDAADGSSYNYTVTDVQMVGKSDLVLDEVFDRSGTPRLVLVTCGGRWDAKAGSYTDNVIVTATAAD